MQILKMSLAVLFSLSLTSCAELSDGVETFGKRLAERLEIDQVSEGSSASTTKVNSSFYDGLVALTNGKASGSSIRLKTSKELFFKAVNSSTLVGNEYVKDIAEVDIIKKELKTYNISLKENSIGKQCLKEPIGYNISTYEFKLNSKRVHVINAGWVCAQCLHDPMIITTGKPCDVLKSIHPEAFR